MLDQITKKLHNLRHVLWACRGIVVLGFMTSAWGNVLSAQKGWVPVILSLVAPVILLAAFEVMSRIPFPDKGSGWLRWAGTGLRLLAMGAIVVIMMITSYRHQYHAFYLYGGDHLQAQLLPGAIDAFMIVGSLSVIEVQIFIRKYEMQIAGLKDAKAAKEVVVDVKEKPLNGRERIAVAVKEMPWASPKEIAIKAQVKEDYAANIMSQLRRAAARANGHSTGAAVAAN